MNSCIFPHCNSNFDTQNVKFFKVPSISNSNNRILTKLSKLRRNKWVKVIGIGPDLPKDACVCSKHFHKTGKVSVRDFRNPDWAPSKNLGPEDISIRISHESAMSLLCRLCLEPKELPLLIRLNDFYWQNMPIIQVIEYATPLIIGTNEGCPTHICLNCFDRVKIAYNLKKECLQTNQIILGLKQFTEPCEKSDEFLMDYEEDIEYLDDSSQDVLIAIKNENILPAPAEKEEPPTPPEAKPKVKSKRSPRSKPVNDSKFQSQSQAHPICYEIIDSAMDEEPTVRPIIDNQPQDIIIEETIIITPASSIPFEEEAERTRLELEQLKKSQFVGSCYMCNINFHLKGEKRKHYQEVHSKETEHICRLCQHKANSANLLNKHMKIHFAANLCELCGAKFISQSLLQKHMVTNHMTEEEKEKLRNKECKICGRKFIFNSVLKNHMETHSDNKAFSCPECTMKFTSKIALNRHLLSHGYEAKFRCPECNRGFVVMNEFLRHRDKCCAK